MARNTSKQEEVRQLILRSEQARGQLDAKVSQLRHQLDVPNRLRSSLGRHPSAWMFGSMASGLVASSLFRRRPAKKPVKKKKGMVTILLGLTLTAVKPAAKVWLANRAKDWLAGRPGPAPSRRIPS